MAAPDPGPGGFALPGEEAVQAAVEDGGPDLVFQPIVDLRDRRIIGFEALARFPTMPMVPPETWFEAAHGVGLGLELEATAVLGAVEAASLLPSDAYMGVNVSPELVLSPVLEPLLKGAPAGQLVLEITEHARVDDYGDLREALGRVREEGIRVAIDDVGAGFSSLRHVLRLEPEIIKLDIEITQGVESDPARATVVGGLIAGASALSAFVVAEGIETEAQLERLAELGVRGGQGFLIGHPSDSLHEAIESGTAAVAALRVQEAAVSAPPSPRASLEGARILVVDDSPAHRLLSRTIFELEGAVVREAGTVGAALEAIEEMAFDLVLLDVRLPDGTGFDLLEQIRQRSDAPALFVTAATAVSDRVAALDLGAWDYVLKPFSPEELVARADSVLRRRLGG